MQLHVIRALVLLFLYLCTTFSLPTNVEEISLDGINTKKIYAVRVLKNGTVWIVSETGVYFNDGTQWLPTRCDKLFYEEVPKYENVSFSKESNDKPYLRYATNFYRMTDSLTPERLIQMSRLFHHLIEVDDSTIYYVSQCSCGHPSQEVNLIKGDSGKTLLYPIEDTINSLHITPEKSVIIAVERKGIFRVENRDQIPMFTTLPNAEYIDNISQFGSTFWASTREETPANLVYSQDGEEWSEVPSTDTGYIKSILFSDSLAWIYYKNSTTIQEMKNWELQDQVTAENSRITGSIINDIELDSSGNLWVASNEGLTKLKYISTSTIEHQKLSKPCTIHQQKESIEIHFSHVTNTPAVVKAISPAGRVLHTTKVQSPQSVVSIPLRNISSGILLLSITQQGVTQSTKILIE